MFLVQFCNKKSVTRNYNIKLNYVSHIFYNLVFIYPLGITILFLLYYYLIINPNNTRYYMVSMWLYIILFRIKFIEATTNNNL